jgi:hypothetical protein
VLGFTLTTTTAKPSVPHMFQCVENRGVKHNVRVADAQDPKLSRRSWEHGYLHGQPCESASLDMERTVLNSMDTSGISHAKSNGTQDRIHTFKNATFYICTTNEGSRKGNKVPSIQRRNYVQVKEARPKFPKATDLEAK